ncbi:hypothetical protein RJ640_024431 [Escallonia rubra]|uniref:FAR1 domain-containing protein n=1 Tax=Escallonia rubra TaxID=112253 RepID=A0AA88RLF0_9ASTE|nr:hypothetical protein RJ640_024431 [Escallonia rubra]
MQKPASSHFQKKAHNTTANRLRLKATQAQPYCQHLPPQSTLLSEIVRSSSAYYCESWPAQSSLPCLSPEHPPHKDSAHTPSYRPTRLVLEAGIVSTSIMVRWAASAAASETARYPSTIASAGRLLLCKASLKNFPTFSRDHVAHALALGSRGPPRNFERASWHLQLALAQPSKFGSQSNHLNALTRVTSPRYRARQMGLDSSNYDVLEVENPHFEDGVHDIGEAQSITFKDCDTHAETITVRNYDARDGGKGCSEFDSEQILGKVFATEEEACFFYNQYALVKGFGTRLHFSNKRGAMKQVYRKQLVCNKQGFKCLKDKRHIGRQPKRRRETRIGCEAMFQISLSKDGYWFVEKFNDVHNHEMIGTPSKVIKYRSHSRFHRSRACKRLISDFSESGLRPCQITKAVNIIKPFEEVDITPKQCSSIS